MLSMQKGTRLPNQIPYKYGSLILSTGEVSALDFIDWRTGIAGHTTPTSDAALVIHERTGKHDTGSRGVD